MVSKPRPHRQAEKLPGEHAAQSRRNEIPRRRAGIWQKGAATSLRRHYHYSDSDICNFCATQRRIVLNLWFFARGALTNTVVAGRTVGT